MLKTVDRIPALVEKTDECSIGLLLDVFKKKLTNCTDLSDILSNNFNSKTIPKNIEITIYVLYRQKKVALL